MNPAGHPMTPCPVNGPRLLAELAELAQIGADPTGGVTRLAYTPTDLEARNWFANKARQAGLHITVDPLGNILAVEPEHNGRPPVFGGSHLDTVRRGGRFDGMLGVMAALEAVRSIRDRASAGRRFPLGVLVLAAEESTRFGSACLGSRAIVGDLPEADLHRLVDAGGVTLFNALRQAGLAPEKFTHTRRSPGWFTEFVELHVDQADDLFRAGTPLGVITAIAAPTRLWVTFEGRQAHSGAALMHHRRDALAGAAELVLAVETAARANADREIVGTVGVLRARPESMNTVPGVAELGVDIRGINAATVEQVVQQVTTAAQQIAAARRLKVKINTISRGQPVQVAPDRVQALARACTAVGAGHIRMVSRSAHDAMYLGRHGPIGMLFVRNPAGISHNPDETATNEDIVLGASALATYLAWRAG